MSQLLFLAENEYLHSLPNPFKNSILKLAPYATLSATDFKPSQFKGLAEFRDIDFPLLLWNRYFKVAEANAATKTCVFSAGQTETSIIRLLGSPIYRGSAFPYKSETLKSKQVFIYVIGANCVGQAHTR